MRDAGCGLGETAATRAGSGEGERHGTVFPGIVAASTCMRETLALLARVAPHDTAVLLQGETGTGKELLARAVHACSPRARHQLVALNCAAIPEHLLESELFGYRRGAFTGAQADKPGLLAMASGGTLFLDEVAELPLALQAKLLRVLQEGSYLALGAVRPTHADVRVVAATNAPLPARVEAGSFRRDLYHRLAAFPIRIAPLHERPADIGPLARHFLVELAMQHGGAPVALSPEALAVLVARPWPGNARELRNALERAVILRGGPRLDAADFTFLEETTEPPPGDRQWTLPVEGVDLPTLTRSLVQAAFERTGRNVTRAARLLGLSRPALRYRLRKYGLGT